MLPPGPRAPASWQTFRFITDPLGYSKRVTARYGKTIRVRALNATGVATSDPEMAKIIFAAPPETYDSVPAIGELFGPVSVLATAGATHRRQRKLLNPRFHGAQMRGLLATMQRVIEEHFAALAKAQAHGTPVVFIDLAQGLTLDIIMEAVLGASRDFDREPTRSILKELVAALAPSIFGAPFMRARWNPAWRRFLSARAAFDALVEARVAERRRAAVESSDLLGALLDARYDDGEAMSVDEIKDQLFTILIAGHETTAVSLAWAAYFLTREPAVRQRLRDELATVNPTDIEAIAKLPYLDAVCNETLRIEPSVTDVARMCKRPLALGPYTVPAGECVFVNSAMLLRDEDLYPEPLRFRPERFLERKFGPSEYTPFGGGQRRCLGAAFAEAELRLAVATLARDWELALASPAPEVAVRRNITMGPKHGVRLRVLSERPRPGAGSSAPRAQAATFSE